MNSEIVKLEFNEAKESSFKMYFREKATVQKDRRIGEYINQLGNKIPIISEFYGTILQIDHEEKKIVIEKCRHEMVFRSLCSHCGCSMPKATTYISLHSDITFSEEKAKKEEENIVKKYLDNKKLILLLDIDNTILHASNFDISKDEFESLKKIYDWEIACIHIPLFGYDKLYPIKQKIFIKLRPKLKLFLESIRDKYEIYIYTQGTKDYAEEIIKYINSTFEYPYFSNERLVARTGVNWEFKSIKRIFPTTEDMVVILDDRIDVWKDDSKYLINLIPYYFFYDEKSFRIKSKFRVEDDDYILFSIEKLLLFVNSSFYYFYEKFNKKFDVKLILENKIKNILENKKFTFSGLYSKDMDIYNTRNGYLIQTLGGSLYEEYDEDVDIILTKEYKKTTKIKDATIHNKLILHEAWLEYCAFFLIKINEEDFKLTHDNPRLHIEKLKLKYVFNRNVDNIINYYSTDEDKLIKFLQNIDTNIKDNNNILPNENGKIEITEKIENNNN